SHRLIAESRNENMCGLARKCTEAAPNASSAAASERNRFPPLEIMWLNRIVAVAHRISAASSRTPFKPQAAWAVESTTSESHSQANQGAFGVVKLKISCRGT